MCVAEGAVGREICKCMLGKVERVGSGGDWLDEEGGCMGKMMGWWIQLYANSYNGV